MRQVVVIDCVAHIARRYNFIAQSHKMVATHLGKVNFELPNVGEAIERFRRDPPEQFAL